MRYAVYLTPVAGSTLERTAARWLGRSAFAGDVAAGPVAPPEAGIAEPARYGFHATMRAPFSLRDDVDQATLVTAFREFAAVEPAASVALTPEIIHHFVALTAVDESAVSAAAERTVLAFEPFRMALSAADRERRRPDRLDARERELLDAYGYPYVMERFRFHMTLTGSLSADAMAVAHPAAMAHFEPLLPGPHPLVFALFREDKPGGPFHILATEDRLR